MDGLLERGQPSYPERLAGLSDAPERLHVRGTWSETPLAVSIVGARAASGHKLALARELAVAVCNAGGLVISGGALGVDAAAHRGALAARGRTCAVMGSGLGDLYPRQHRELFAAIIKSGALLSPFEPATPPRRYQFVRRNRVIAALADLVVVVEADRASGSLYTARAAVGYGRRLAAVPGSPGCEALIAQGALPIESPYEIVAAARGQLVAPAPRLPEGGTVEARVLAALDSSPRDAIAIAGATGLDARRVSRALVELELSRLALALPGTSYVRV